MWMRCGFASCSWYYSPITSSQPLTYVPLSDSFFHVWFCSHPSPHSFVLPATFNIVDCANPCFSTLIDFPRFGLLLFKANHIMTSSRKRVCVCVCVCGSYVITLKNRAERNGENVWNEYNRVASIHDDSTFAHTCEPPWKIEYSRNKYMAENATQTHTHTYIRRHQCIHW